MCGTKTIYVLVSALLVVFTGSTANAAPAIVHTGQGTQALEDVFVPCANGGAGELVAFDGYLHYRWTNVTNGTRFTITENYNPQGLRGTGVLSGDVYIAVGKHSYSVTADHVEGWPWEQTNVSRFHFVSPTSGINFWINYTQHTTVNDNGIVTISFLSEETVCK